ncbi:MAG: DUF4349 domain-containing protein [Treponema sp.]|jgi:hypothetical protein|nr:DUF4349 domain-containing protein [Treponema sp.]
MIGYLRGIVMLLKKFALKTWPCIVIFALFSCYSGPKNTDDPMNYSDIFLSKRVVYNIDVHIFNKDIALLKQNVFDAIFQNDGQIIREDITINTHRTTVSMPRNSSADFLLKIRSFGVVVSENIQGSSIGEYFGDTERRLTYTKNILEKCNDLLQNATDISDRLMLEKEINNAKMEIEAMERGKQEMESRIENNTIVILMANK